MFVTKATGEKEIFDSKKLEKSLKRAGASEESVSYIVEHIENELRDGDTTQEIYRHAHDLLSKESPLGVAARYSLRRAILELGPHGYAFEDFVGEILKKKGYTIEVGKVMSGKCVEHEVDVFATNAKELILVEAKFHNKVGFKTDVKVALYIQARFEDLGKVDYGGLRQSHQKVQCWLITNTKFTEDAIQYGECAGMHMIGWGYPAHGNIQDLIEEAGLHPLSVLSTLSRVERQALFDKKVVLCSSIAKKESVLGDIGLSKDKIGKVMEEVDKLCGVKN
jgi:hypothetical protein